MEECGSFRLQLLVLWRVATQQPGAACSDRRTLRQGSHECLRQALRRCQPQIIVRREIEARSCSQRAQSATSGEIHERGLIWVETGHWHYANLCDHAPIIAADPESFMVTSNY